MEKLNRKQIEELLPHREPMLLIDELYNIKKLEEPTSESMSRILIKYKKIDPNIEEYHRSFLLNSINKIEDKFKREGAEGIYPNFQNDDFNILFSTKEKYIDICNYLNMFLNLYCL